MRYLSICSGIEAATQAWHPLGWQPIAFSEIEPFPSAVLAHHYPSVPNLGDMTRFREWPTELLAEVDILVGGTPCQAFSVAGLRQSLDDERGNLTLTFVHLHDHITAIRHAAGRPAPLLCWENVPGVLNTADNAFGCFLGGLAGEHGALQPPGGRWKDAGYVRGPSRTIAWRLLDAQYFGLAQRRERVFLVAGPPGFRAEQVLFELNGLRRDSPPSREEGQGSARAFETDPQGGRFTDLHPTIDTRCKDGPIQNQLGCGVLEAVAFGGNNTSGAIPVAAALNANRGAHNPGDFESGTLLVQDTTHTLRGEGFDASEDGTGRGTPIIAEICPTLRAGGNRTGGDRSYVAIGFDRAQITSPQNRTRCAPELPASTLSKDSQMHVAIGFSARSRGDDGRGYDRPPQVFGDVVGALETMKPHQVAIGFSGKDSGQDAAEGLAPTLRAGNHNTSHANGGNWPAVATLQPAFAVRRLTPTECERLQGFPDNFTAIPWRGKPADQCPDGPRYRALGNSMAVPVMHWIGKRIDKVINSTTPAT